LKFVLVHLGRSLIASNRVSNVVRVVNKKGGVGTPPSPRAIFGNGYMNSTTTFPKTGDTK